MPRPLGEPAEKIATYRLQLGPELDFRRVAELVPAFAELGISHLYLSPIFEAAPGSSHGYDVVDHDKVSQALGGELAFIELAQVAREHGLGLVVDWVPNHMAIAPENAWWWDVLESGPSSIYAEFFDVDWHPPETRNHNIILLPLLGDHRGTCIARGEIKVVRRDGRFMVMVRELTLPVAPRTIADLLARAKLADPPAELGFLIDAFRSLPGPVGIEPEARRRRHRDKGVLAELVRRLCDAHPEVCQAVDRALEDLTLDAPALDAFLEAQNYRLAHWRVGRHELDYRRFFDVNHLVGLRAEEPAVFSASHRKLAYLVKSGYVDGVRVDHVDGLADPGQYLDRLRHVVGPAWVVVEKILAPDERLPSAWPVAGTTGYDFLAQLTALFVDQQGWRELDTLRREHTGELREYEAVSREAREQVMVQLLASDLERLTQQLVELTSSQLELRDVTRPDLRLALRSFIAQLPVYRTYLEAGTLAGDRAIIAEALRKARLARSELDPVAFDALGFALGQEGFTRSLQQLTGAVMAKGVEDTAFFRWTTLLATAEVGDDPGRYARPFDAVAAFHFHNRDAAERCPERMLTTSTHDTKRSEDVRARLLVLSQRPAFWAQAASALGALSRGKHEGGAPDPDLELLFFQTLLGAWPISKTRLHAVMEKSAREARRNTSWINNNHTFEAGLHAYIDACFADELFVSMVNRLAASLDVPGRIISLAQVVLKLTSPGIPDLYQGTCVFNYSLVDPDNRRPVDFEQLRRLLAESKATSAAAAWAISSSGLPKLLVTRRLLALRRARPRCFKPGMRYEPVDVGPASVAFTLNDEILVCVPIRVDAAQKATIQLQGRWSCVLTRKVWQGQVEVRELYRDFPVTVLERA